MVDTIRQIKKKNARRQYVRVILRNLFINNHILSHAIQEFLLSIVSVWHSPHCVNNTRHPAEEDPPTTRNRLPRNGIDIYLPHILFIVRKNYQQKENTNVNKGVHRISILCLTRVYAYVFLPPIILYTTPLRHGSLCFRFLINYFAPRYSHSKLRSCYFFVTLIDSAPFESPAPRNLINNIHTIYIFIA